MTTSDPTRLAVTPHTSGSGGHNLLLAAAVAGAVGCSGYISTIVLLSDLSIRDAVRSPITITSNIVVAVAFALLAALVPLMAARLALPRWAGLLAAVGCAAVGATAWGTGTLAVHAAGLLTESQMEANSGWFSLFQAPQSLPCAIGFIALGLSIARRRAASRGAGILLVVAGAASLMPAYPPGALLASLGLLWVAQTEREPGPSLTWQAPV